jgi:hypothetical protein
MTSLGSFSQIDTSKNSLICIPREYVTQATAELIMYDFLKEEVESLKRDTTELNEIIFYRDFIISRRDDELKYYISILDSCNNNRAHLEAKNQILTTKLQETQDKLSTYKRIVNILPFPFIGILLWEGFIKNE